MTQTRILRTVIFAMVVALLTFVVDRTILCPSPVAAAPETPKVTYKCVQLDGNTTDAAKAEKALNAMTSDGWQFQSAVFCTLIFKK